MEQCVCQRENYSISGGDSVGYVPGPTSFPVGSSGGNFVGFSAFFSQAFGANEGVSRIGFSLSSLEL
jgi:hypothetical protein